MKKTSDRHERRLPVSQKAYNRFRERILKVNDLFAVDPHYMLWLFEEYMNGRTHLKSGGGLACDLAFEMLRIEIDAAIARSARARKNARLRRERKERERREQQENQECKSNTSPAADTDSDCKDVRLHNDVSAGRVTAVISSARDRRCASDTWCGDAG